MQNIYDNKGYSSAMHAHEVVTPLEEKRDKHGGYVNVVKEDSGKLTQVFLDER